MRKMCLLKHLLVLSHLRRVHVAEGGLPDCDGEPPGRRGLSHRVHLHVQPGQKTARHVEGRVAVGLVALDAGAHASLLAHPTAAREGQDQGWKLGNLTKKFR